MIGIEMDYLPMDDHTSIRTVSHRGVWHYQTAIPPRYHECYAHTISIHRSRVADKEQEYHYCPCGAVRIADHLWIGINTRSVLTASDAYDTILPECRPAAPDRDAPADTSTVPHSGPLWSDWGIRSVACCSVAAIVFSVVLMWLQFN